MVCQNCASLDLQKLSLVFEYGLSHIATSTGGVGVGVGMGGIGVGVGGGNTRGTQVSAIALRAAPPKQRTTTAAVWMVLCAIIAVFCFISRSETAATYGVFFLAAAAGAFFMLRSTTQYNRDVWPGLWQAWDRSYLCLRCGTMAAPQLASAPAMTMVQATPLTHEAKLRRQNLRRTRHHRLNFRHSFVGAREQASPGVYSEEC